MFNLKSLFKKKYIYRLKVSILVKSGVTITVFCDDIEISNNGNELTACNLTGFIQGNILYLNLSEVVHISYISWNKPCSV